MESKVYNIDSRRISEILSPDVEIQTTITSPPYFDMKDYGVEGQVGYGQKYQEYLADLKLIFEQVYDFTKVNGTLWIVIDTFKRNNAVVPLPFDLSSKLQEVGWLLQDIFIWKKDKTVPWSNSGFTQRKFEYILLFSKSGSFKNNKDKIRIYDTNKLKKWWIKYPERYNPKGKALDEIWEYPIPVQGSWGNKYIRHFCPLPKDMVSNMIQISTDEGDIVFDPFAGSGTVLSQSAYMKRQYLGFELNSAYIEMFEAYLKDTLEGGLEEYAQLSTKDDQSVFEDMILNLRALKYGRLLVKKIQAEVGDALKVYVDRKHTRNINKDTVEYIFNTEEDSKYIDLIDKLISIPPLSKFEISPIFKFERELPSGDELYSYSITNSYSYMKHPLYNKKSVRIVSPIMVDFKESDYE